MSTASAVAPVPEIEPVASPPPIIVPKSPRGRKRYLILAVVTVAATLAGLWAWQARRRERGAAAGSLTASTAKVERRTFVRTLRLSGTLEAVRSYSVLAPRLTGGDYGQMVLTKLTPGGTRVKKGDLLAEFDREAQLKNFIWTSRRSSGTWKSDRLQEGRAGGGARPRRHRTEAGRGRGGHGETGSAAQ